MYQTKQHKRSLNAQRVSSSAANLQESQVRNDVLENQEMLKLSECKSSSICLWSLHLKVTLRSFLSTPPKPENSY